MTLQRLPMTLAKLSEQEKKRKKRSEKRTEAGRRYKGEGCSPSPCPPEGLPPRGQRAKKVTNPSDIAYNKGEQNTNRKVSNMRNYSIHHVSGQHLLFKDRKEIERVWNANCLLKRPNR